MQLTSSNDGFLKGVSSWVVVEPIDPFEGGVLDLVELTPGTTVVNDLGLEQSDDRLGEGVVVRVADAADRRLDAGLLQALSVTNREILAAPVAPDESRPWSWSEPHSACSSASRTRSVCIERATRQPMMRRENTSMTKATYINPAQVATYVKSATQS